MALSGVETYSTRFPLLPGKLRQAEIKWKRSGNKQEKSFRFISSPRGLSRTPSRRLRDGVFNKFIPASVGKWIFNLNANTGQRSIVSRIGRDRSEIFHHSPCGCPDQSTFRSTQLGATESRQDPGIACSQGWVTSMPRPPFGKTG